MTSRDIIQLAMTMHLEALPTILSLLYGKWRISFVLIATTTFVTAFFAPTEHGFLLFIVSMSTYVLASTAINRPFQEFHTDMRLLTAAIVPLLPLVCELLYPSLALPTDSSHSVFGTLPMLAAIHCVDALLCCCMVLTVELLRPPFSKTYVNYSDALRADQQDSFAAFTDCHPNAVCVLDLRHRIQSINPSFERMLGYTFAELQNRAPEELELTQYGVVRNLVDDALTNGHANQEVSCLLRHKDGRLIPCRITTVPIFSNAQPTGCYGVLRDVTIESQTQASLHKADKLAVIGELAAGMAHEIRNPLTSVFGFLQLLQERGSVPKYFDIIREELTHIEFICSEFLVLSRPQVKKKQTLQLPAVVRDVMNGLSNYASRFAVQLNLQIRHSQTWIAGHENDIKQVCINVIRNAIEAMPKGGIVDIIICSDDSHVLLCIHDSGVGMSATTISHLGEPFYTTKGHGIGLGLMITHRIVEQISGKIEYQSELGKGTTVRISFDKFPA